MKKKGHLILLVATIFILSVTSVYAAPIYGDLNKDGIVDSTDYVLMNRHILGVGMVTDTSIADLNGDNLVNSTDYILLKRFLMGIITQFPVQVSNPNTDSDDEAWKNNTGTIQLGSSITYTGTGISVEGSVVNITSGGDHEVTGTLTNGMIYVNTKERVKLRLSGVNITNLNGPAIYFADTDKSFITITKSTVNYLTDGRVYKDEEAKGTLFSNDDLEIKGSGTLYITGNYKHGIVSDDDIIIENGNIIINAITDGIHANNKIKVTGGNLDITADSDGIDSEDIVNIEDGTISIKSKGNGVKAATSISIKGGTFNINSESDAIDSKGDIVIEGGTITAKTNKDGIKAVGNIKVHDGEFNITVSSDGIESDGLMEINGGNFTISANDDGLVSRSDLIINGGIVSITKSYEGIESKGSLIINGGEINITASDDGLNASKNITINGGNTYISANRDAVDSNGSININGGYIFAVGGNNPEGSFDCDRNTFSITGGTVIGLAANTSQPTVSATKQCVAVLGGASANVVVSIRRNGSEIISFTAPKTYQTLVFSSPDLALNTSYTIHSNGTQTGSFTTNSMVTVSGGTIFAPGGGIRR